MPPPSWNALIRTHHITSRKKVSKLRQAASNCNVYALIRYGGAPGIMYVEGEEHGVAEWVEFVHNLRYKFYYLAAKPAEVCREGAGEGEVSRAVEMAKTGLVEAQTVKEFGRLMEERRVYGWWRVKMGFAPLKSDP